MVRLLFRFVVVCFGVVIVFWLLFFAPFTANQRFIIKLRNYYYESFLKLDSNEYKYRGTGKVGVNFRVVGLTDKGKEYSYVFMGKYAKYDLSSNKLELFDDEGRLNAFTLKMRRSVRSPDLYYFHYQKTDDFLGKDGQDSWFVIDSTNLENVDIPFQDGDLIKVYWSDAMKYTQIINQWNNGGAVIIDSEKGGRVVKIEVGSI